MDKASIFLNHDVLFQLFVFDDDFTVTVSQMMLQVEGNTLKGTLSFIFVEISSSTLCTFGRQKVSPYIYFFYLFVFF